MPAPCNPLKPGRLWQGMAMISGSEPTPAADAAAWSLVGLLVFCTLCFLGGAMVLRRREHDTAAQQGADQSVSQVERSEKESTKKSDAPDEDPKRQPWERGADWWKTQG